MSTAYGMIEISDRAQALRFERDKLIGQVAALNKEIERATAFRLPIIRRAVARTAETHSELFNAIDLSRDLFKSPRTILLYNIKVGLRKGQGGITWEDGDQVVRLIEKHFPDQAALLIKTVKTPVAKTLEDLDVSDLKKLGCKVEDTGDQVVIKPMDSAVDKTVKALLKNAVEEAQSEVA